MHRPLFDLKNLLDRFLVENITAYPVHCICGIAYNGTTAELVSYLLYCPGLRIIGINRNQHGFSLAVSM